MTSGKVKTLNTSRFDNFWLPLFFVVFNIVIKSLYIGTGDIAGDEPFTIFWSQADMRSFFDMLKTENNPPFFFILLHFWIKFFGISAISVRILPMIFSSLTSLVIYKFSTRFFNLRIAILATLIYSFSNFHIFFAHETRVYSLFTLLTTLSMYAFLSLESNYKPRWSFFLLVLSNILLIYSHFFGFFVLFIQIFICLTVKKFRHSIGNKYLYILAISFLAYLPYLQLLFMRFQESSGGTWVPFPSVEDLYTNLWKFSNAPVNTVVFLVIILVSVLMLIYWRKSNSDDELLRWKLLIIWFFVPYLSIFLISLKLPIFLDRYLIFLSPAFYMLIAVSLNHMFRKQLIYNILSVVLVAMMILSVNLKEGSSRNTSEIVKFIRAKQTPQSAVYIHPKWLYLGFTYYYDRSIFEDYRNIMVKLNSRNIFPIYTFEELNQENLNRAKSILLMEGAGNDGEEGRLIMKKLKESFPKEELDETFQGLRIYHLTK